MSQTKAQLINGKSATIEFTGGSASAPAVSFTGDTNTGIYSPGGDQVAISTNGSGRLFINSSGNVGVGIASPTTTFDVAGNARLHNSASNTNRKLEMRSTQGYSSFIQFTEDNIADRWSLGIANGDGGFIFKTGADFTGTERLRITSAGNVGIGTTTPSDQFVISNNGAAGFEIGTATNQVVAQAYNRSGAAYVNLTDACSNRIFQTGGNTERARIDSSGRLLVGTSSTSAGDVKLLAQVASGTTGPSSGTAPKGIAINHPGGNGSYGGLWFSEGFGDDQGISGIAGFRINNYQTELRFYTNETPSARSFGERMKITSAGQLWIGQSSSYPTCNGRLGVTSDSTSTATPTLAVVNPSASAVYVAFSDSGSIYGSISRSGSSTVYATSSDYRLKENVTLVTDGITRLQQLKPSRFNFIADPSTVVDGFIAHEVQTVVPEAIRGVKDEVDADGNPVYQGIDQSKLVPLLTAALQEAVAKIESLEARLTAAGI